MKSSLNFFTRLSAMRLRHIELVNFVIIFTLMLVLGDIVGQLPMFLSMDHLTKGFFQLLVVIFQFYFSISLMRKYVEEQLLDIRELSKIIGYALAVNILLGTGVFLLKKLDGGQVSIAKDVVIRAVKYLAIYIFYPQIFIRSTEEIKPFKLRVRGVGNRFIFFAILSILAGSFLTKMLFTKTGVDFTLIHWWATFVLNSLIGHFFLAVLFVVSIRTRGGASNS